VPLGKWAESTSGPFDAPTGGPNSLIRDRNTVEPVVNMNIARAGMNQQGHDIAGGVPAFPRYLGGDRMGVAAGAAVGGGYPAGGQASGAVDIPAVQPRPRVPSIVIPPSSLARVAAGGSQHNNSGVLRISQGMGHGQTEFHDNTNHAGIRAPCLGFIPMMDIRACDRGCGQYLVLKDGQAFGHLSRDAVLSLSQDEYGRFQGRMPVSQEQSPSEELADGVGNMGFGSQNTYWANSDSSPSSSHYSYGSA